MDWPFLAAEALVAKALSERAMRSTYASVYPGVYCPIGVELSARQRAHAAWLWSRRRAVVAGNSAAALLGARWVSPSLGAELIYDNRKPPDRITVHSDALACEEVLTIDGIALTSPARTAFDIGRWTPSRLHAVQRLDALAHATDLKAVDVEAVIAEHSGTRGLTRLRRTLPLVDGGSESPQETRTRLALLDAGFPIPRTQVPVFAPGAYLVARLDIGWDEWRVGVEYDGAQHWTDPAQRTRDIDRWAEICDCGWTVIRVNNDILRYRRGNLIHRVGAALSAAGWQP